MRANMLLTIFYLWSKHAQMNKYIVLIIAIFFSASAYAQNQTRFSDIKPGMQDTELEWQAIKEANKRGLTFCWKEDFTKAVIISPKWELEMDSEGFVKWRKIHMVLYAVQWNGRCAITDFTFKQKLLPDETFSDKLYYQSVGDMVYVECE
jgi:hypothetical protein